MAADPATLAVVGHQDHGGAVELAALLEEGEEVADAAVGLGELVEVLGAAHAAHVAELVGGEQLEHEQVGVLLVDHAPRLGRERAVDLGRSAAPTSRSGPPPRRTGRAGARCPRAGRGGPSRSSTSKTDSRRTPSRGAKLERMPCSAGVAPVSIDEKQTTVRAGYAGSTARYSVPSRASRSMTGASRLPQALAVAAVDDDHVHAPRERGGAPARGAAVIARAGAPGSAAAGARTSARPARPAPRRSPAAAAIRAHASPRPAPPPAASPALSAIRSFGSCSSALPLVGSEFVSTRRQKRSAVRPRRARCAGGSRPTPRRRP